MRDKFYQERLALWRKMHKKEPPESVRKRLYDNAQARAAKIYNAKHKENPVGRYD